jgi:fructose-1,6-bisphosphatase/inositol monophosphatase family enzyme
MSGDARDPAAPIAALLEPIRTLHDRIRDAVVAACERVQTVQDERALALTGQAEADGDDLARIVDDRDDEGDTIYAVDRVSEEVLIHFFDTEIATRWPIVLIAEGLPGGQLRLPRGTADSDALWRIIVDPIDGTRGLMYQKRSGWILTGVARNRGPSTSLADIELAVQTEIPLVKQHLCDAVWAQRGGGAHAERLNRLTGERHPLTLRPSRAATIAHGFAMISRFFPGARAELAAIDEEIVHATLGPVRPGKAQCFEDQYISTGGQLYELMAGRDRFVADLRPLMEALLARRGLSLGICCHPYDLCTELIARELGVIVTDEHGQPLRAPLDIDANVTWAGYANAQIRAQIEPALRHALEARGLLAAAPAPATDSPGR